MKEINSLLIVVLLSFVFACSSSEPDPMPDPDPDPITSPLSLIVVPTDFNTIQEAIEMSDNGDTIVVEPGTYFENIILNGKDILLTSRFYESQDISFIDRTIINGSKATNRTQGSVVRYMDRETPASIIQGFTLTGGTGTLYVRPNGNTTLGGGGILAFKSSPTIRYNKIIGNLSTDISGANPFAGGGGLRMELGRPMIHNNFIFGNRGGFGGGVFLDHTSTTLENNIIVNNSATKGEFGGGGGLYLDFADVSGDGNRVINNTIVDNKSIGEGGGLVLAGGSVYEKLVFINNIIFNNQKNEVFTRLDAAPSGFRPAHCLIEGGWSFGATTIDADPELTLKTYYLSDTSPCIDAGMEGAEFEDNQSSEMGPSPSKGTSRNDIGAYGGPKAFTLIE